EAFGSTHLTQVGNNYFLFDSSGSGPSLKYVGVNIVVGQWGGWAPIGGEATSTGYEAAWKLAGADQYTVWNTDNNGNDTTNTIGTVSGSSTALQSLELGFHQDLNGDGVIGIPSASTGATHDLPVTIANNDTFLFSSILGADAVAALDFDAFSSLAKHTELAALVNDAQTGPSEALDHWASEEHDTAVDPGNYDT